MATSPPRRVVAGFGCRQGCPLAELQALLSHALTLAGASLSDLLGIATLDRRLHEPGLLALAASLQLPLVGYTPGALAPFEPWLSQRSLVSWRHTGCHGVAESAALAHAQALGSASPALAVGRQAGRWATIALATT